jgi:transcription initiation factor TFIID subunit TAF12
MAFNDWGFEISGRDRLPTTARDWRRLFSTRDLLEDLYKGMARPQPSPAA